MVGDQITEDTGEKTEIRGQELTFMEANSPMETDAFFSGIHVSRCNPEVHTRHGGRRHQLAARWRLPRTSISRRWNSCRQT